MRRELLPGARLPLFGLTVMLAGVVVVLLVALDPPPGGHPARHALAPAPPPLVLDGSPCHAAIPMRPPRGAGRVGRRFLRLYAQLQGGSPDAAALLPLRSLTTLALGHTLLAQPPQPAGGGRARGRLTRVHIDALSSSAVRLHATVRRGRLLLRVRCLVQRDRGRWTVTAFAAAG